MDMLKTGGASAEKRMYKFAKKRVSDAPSFSVSPCSPPSAWDRDLCFAFQLLESPKMFGGVADTRTVPRRLQLGTHKRALRKREDIKDVYARMKAKAAM